MARNMFQQMYSDYSNYGFVLERPNSGTASPGYDRDKFIDSQELDEFSCGICHGIFKNPMVAECCGQTYCSYCITQWLIHNNTCPNDRRPLTSDNLKEPPKAFKNLLANLKIKCNFYSEGCKLKCVSRIIISRNVSIEQISNANAVVFKNKGIRIMIV